MLDLEMPCEMGPKFGCNSVGVVVVVVVVVITISSISND